MSKFIGVQENILNAVDKNQLVSAGAGSGKTTVMIQKIADLILKEQVDVDNLLVVTFTVLAANEMKQRLIKKLTDELNKEPNKAEKIISTIEKIKTANIDTIDGFSSKTIKKYFYELEISPNIEIVSDASKDYYLTSAMKQTMDYLKKQTEDVNMLLDCFGGNRRSLEEVEDLILSCYYNVINLENPEEFLNTTTNEYRNSTKSENVVNNKIIYAVNALKEQVVVCYSQVDENLKTKLDKILDYANNFNSKLNLKYNLGLFLNFSCMTFSSKQVKENPCLEDVNNAIKKANKLLKTFEENEINLDFEEKNEKSAKIIEVFIKILKIFINNYNKIKEKNNIIDFNDLTRLMLKLLSNDNIKSELQTKFKYIFIDEYQDVNPLQESVISKLAGAESTLFMVGDVKQSIYGFRGANPEEFISKYDSLKQGSIVGEVFDMNLNFRSNPIILNFINELFSKIMTKQTADIDYAKDCLIEPMRDDIIDSKVCVALFNSETENEIAQGVYSVKEESEKNIEQSIDAECKYVLATITDLVGKDFYDANEKCVRKLSYGDIAILSRSEKDEKAKALISLLKQNAVPLNITNKLEVQKSDVIKLVLSILKCVAFTYDDVDILAAMYALTDLTIDEVVEIRNVKNSLVQDFRESSNENVVNGFKILNDIRLNSFTKSNTELVRYILNNKKLKYYILKQVNGEKELGLLEEFLNKISIVENSLSLAEFINVVESNISKSSDYISSDTEDSVTFQTIHKSKGLEYPVVILFNAGKTIPADTDAINFNSDIGLGVDYYNYENRTKQPSLVKYAIAERSKQKNYKEEMRLLYVALTRAKNKLYITGNCTKKALQEKEFSLNNYVNMILDCYLDRVVGNHNEFKNCVIDIYDSFDFDLSCAEEDKKSVVTINSSFKYKNEDKFKIPFKNSVTALNSELAQTSGFKVKDWFKSSVQYTAEEDRALIGTHYHKALEMLNFEQEYKQNTFFEDVDYSKIEKAHASIKTLLSNAKKLKKEAEFMMYVPYNTLVESEVSDRVLVQGVVDLIIENEDTITVVDYKFSTLSSSVLKEKYKEQLMLYKKAVELAHKKPVEHMYIYSINGCELLKI